MVFGQSELDSAQALKQMQNFPIPNFHECEQLLVLEGSTFLKHSEYPLESIINEHYLTDATLTTIAQEQNLEIRPEVKVEDDCYDIYGFCEVKP